jgi:hypothetical protein
VRFGGVGAGFGGVGVRFGAAANGRSFGSSTLESIFRKSTTLANLMRSRLALPLLYPLSTGSYRQPNPIAESKFSHAEIVNSLACITPLIQGTVCAANFLKATHALANYRGGKMRQTFLLKSEDELAVKNRIHEISPRINRKHRARTITGLGAGWDKYGSGRPVDNIQDRWKN